MKLDAHVHTIFSGYSTLRPVNRIMRESYSVEGVLTVALGHFVLEQRFNRGLLRDLVANRLPGIPEVA